MSEVPDLTRQQQLAFMKDKRDMCFDNMEGTDAVEFIRWGSLYNAYATIVDDMKKELTSSEVVPPDSGALFPGSRVVPSGEASELLDAHDFAWVDATGVS